MPGRSLCRTDALRYRPGADVLLARLRQPPHLVEGGIRGLGVERSGLVLSWVRVVEAGGCLVAAPESRKFQPARQRRERKSTLSIAGTSSQPRHVTAHAVNLWDTAGQLGAQLDSLDLARS